jgi:hypothetical protein
MAEVKNEKWILTVKEMHLGRCKETFRAGAVIEFDEPRGLLIIDGRRFTDTRDIDLLKRQAEKNPDNPWVIPYSKEAYDEVMQVVRPAKIAQKKILNPDQQMKVISSDEDLNEEIDIRSTQVSKTNQAAKEAARNKVREEGMPIIRGDESVAERLASLKNKNDMNSIAERANLKASHDFKMAVVRDDSLGNCGGSKTVSLNAGQRLPTREEADAKKEIKMLEAEARKRDAEVARRAATGAIEDEDGQEGQGASEGQDEGIFNDEIESLKTQMNGQKAQMDKMMEMMATVVSGMKSAKSETVEAPKRGRKPGKKGDK